jgi:hypothetical protein
LKKSILIIFISLFAIKNFAQRQYFASLQLHHGQIAKHTKKLYFSPPSNSQQIDALFLIENKDNETWRNNYGHPIFLIKANCLFSNEKKLGNIYSAGLGLQFNNWEYKNIFWKTQLSAGIAYASKHWQQYPYSDSLNNYLGSALNIAIGIHQTFDWQLANANKISFSAGLDHTSNAGIIKPNFGVNYLSLGIGYAAALKNKKAIEKNKSLSNIKNYWGAGIRIGTSRAENGKGNGPLLPIYVTSISANYTIQNKHKLYFGLDAEYNGKEDFFLHVSGNTTNSFGEAFFYSAFVGNEFLFGKFSLPLQLGVYLGSSSSLAVTNSKFGLLYYPQKAQNKYTKKTCFGFLVKVNAFTADYLEACAGYQF